MVVRINKNSENSYENKQWKGHRKNLTLLGASKQWKPLKSFLQSYTFEVSYQHINSSYDLEWGNIVLQILLLLYKVHKESIYTYIPFGVVHNTDVWSCVYLGGRYLVGER